MAIWVYSDVASDEDVDRGSGGCIEWGVTRNGKYSSKPKNGTCGYCQTELTQVGSLGVVAVLACPLCGWWVVVRSHTTGGGGEFEHYLTACRSALRKLDFSDVSTPADELMRYLLLKYKDRFKIHPRKFEEIVAAVFAGTGYQVRLTSYSGDDGIDIFLLDGQQNDLVGIQVKRYEGKIEAEQIRSLGGAMVLNGVTQGVFVTTSTFRRGANRTAKAFQSKGLAIELVDSAAFYDRLHLAQRSMYTNIGDPSLRFRKVLDAPSKFNFQEYRSDAW